MGVGTGFQPARPPPRRRPRANSSFPRTRESRHACLPASHIAGGRVSNPPLRYGARSSSWAPTRDAPTMAVPGMDSRVRGNGGWRGRPRQTAFHARTAATRPRHPRWWAAAGHRIDVGAGFQPARPPGNTVRRQAMPARGWGEIPAFAGMTAGGRGNDGGGGRGNGGGGGAGMTVGGAGLSRVGMSHRPCGGVTPILTFPRRGGRDKKSAARLVLLPLPPSRGKGQEERRPPRPLTSSPVEGEGTRRAPTASSSYLFPRRGGRDKKSAARLVLLHLPPSRGKGQEERRPPRPLTSSPGRGGRDKKGADRLVLLPLPPSRGKGQEGRRPPRPLASSPVEGEGTRRAPPASSSCLFPHRGGRDKKGADRLVLLPLPPSRGKGQEGRRPARPLASSPLAGED